jgi:hypothetical protein
MSIEILKSKIASYEDFVMPETLYKYRDWTDDNHRRLITNREIFFAAPSSFKDQFDCKIPTRWDLLTDEDILQKYYNDSFSIHPEFKEEQRLAFANEWAKNYLIRDEEYVAKHQSNTYKQFSDRTGILSLTEHPAEIPMWEGYSSLHTGFCIGFDGKTILEGGKGKSGGIVRYYDELPIIFPSPKHNYMEQSTIQIFSKLRCWEFEKEYRTFIFNSHPLTNLQRLFVVQPIAFKEIILGAKMDNDIEQEILKSIPKEIGHIKVKKAYLEKGSIVIKDL